jgi:hypothetical protein
MNTRLTFAASLIASTFAVPDLPHSWSASASQDMEGNISGVRPGITLFNEYYNQDIGADRYEYYDKAKPSNEVYRYNDVDPATGCGIVYSFTETSCCHKALLEDDGSCSVFLTIQPTKHAKDLGMTDKGEDWQATFDHFGISQKEDWFVNDDLSINGWYQYIGVGADGDNPQWVTVNIDYTNQIIGQNTDETFAVPASCPKTCLGEELMFSRHQAAKLSSANRNFKKLAKKLSQEATEEAVVADWKARKAVKQAERDARRAAKHETFLN